LRRALSAANKGVLTKRRAFLKKKPPGKTPQGFKELNPCRKNYFLRVAFFFVAAFLVAFFATFFVAFFFAMIAPPAFF
jgi:hypothetical protein